MQAPPAYVVIHAKGWFHSISRFKCCQRKNVCIIPATLSESFKNINWKFYCLL